MFFFHLMLVVTVIFWFCVMVAEVFLTSRDENSLPLILRVGFAYTLSMLWFSAAWRFVPMQWAWFVGLVVLSAVYWVNIKNPGLGSFAARVKSVLKAYTTTFICVLVGINIFLAPLHLSQTYGPFTESGGDVTVYADGAKYFTDKWLPAYGSKDFIWDFNRLKDSPLAGLADNQESLSAFDHVKGNPPAADFAIYRIAVIQRFPAFQFGPTAQWFFMAGHTNHAVFYGVLAFQYAVTVFAVFWFFLRFGRVPAFLSLLITAASYGLVSVWYNVYYLQATSLMISALIVGALLYVRVFSFAGLRTYWPCVAIVCAAYLHYISIIFPFLLMAFIGWQGKGNAVKAERNDLPAIKHIPNERTGKGVRLAGGVVFLVLTATTFVDTMNNVGLYAPLVKRAALEIKGEVGVTPDTKIFGLPLEIPSAGWFGLFFGAFSKNNLDWYSGASKTMLSTLNLAGLAVVLFSFISWPLIFYSCKKNLGQNVKWFFVLFVVAVICIAGHHMIIQSTLYKQAKGSQNVLIVLYIATLLPFSILYARPLKTRLVAEVTTVYGASLVIFGLMLLYPRTALVAELASGNRNSVIIEPSFFSEASRIRQMEIDPLVLFEPRKLADSYFYMQSLVGSRVIPTRLLRFSHWRLLNKPDEPYRGLDVTWPTPADYVNPLDLPNMVLFRALKSGAGEKNSAGSDTKYEWKAQKVSDLKEPELIVLGKDYRVDANYPRGSDNMIGKNWSVYGRSAVVMLFIPPTDHPVELKIGYLMEDDDDPKKIGQIAREAGWMDHLEPGVTVEAEGYNVVFTGRLQESATSRLITLREGSGQFSLDISMQWADSVKK